ncbi:zinc finger, CCHC-type containing protein [Tanacetum coccineum]
MGRPTSLLATRDEPVWVWHSRLGHVNFHSVRKLVEKNMATGVPMFKDPNQTTCEGYVLAKQTQIPYQDQVTFRAKKPLQLVHADLCGPITPTSMSRTRLDTIIVILALAAQHRINFEKGSEFKDLVGFIDSDCGGDPVSGKSTCGMIFYLGRNAITWQSQKQKTVALSSCEAEFMATTLVACQAI